MKTMSNTSMASLCLPSMDPQLNRDAMELNRAFKGLGCDSVAVIRILAHRNALQRSQIRQVYKNIHEEDLCDRIKKESHGNFKRAMLLWILDPVERDATILKNTLRSSISATKRNKILVEILWTKNREESEAIDAAFTSLDGCPLLNLIQATVKSQRCRELYLSHLLCERTYGNAMNDSNGSNSDNEFKEMQESVRECVSERSHFFAKILYKSMKGLGTDDDTLTRVVVTRTEVDMKQIKAAFRVTYGITLQSMISDDTSGSYRKFLLALIGAPY